MAAIRRLGESKSPLLAETAYSRESLEAEQRSVVLNILYIKFFERRRNNRPRGLTKPRN